MIDDEDDTSESESEDDESDSEIQEITALEHFTSTLQQAHDLAAASVDRCRYDLGESEISRAPYPPCKHLI